eukprot:8226930-Ditylum_brightwellii.AAC.1
MMGLILMMQHYCNNVLAVATSAAASTTASTVNFAITTKPRPITATAAISAAAYIAFTASTTSTTATCFHCFHSFRVRDGAESGGDDSCKPAEWAVCGTVVINNYYVSPPKKEE